jgi:hypothetical protein
MNVLAVTKILENAQCKEIEGIKCFVVPWAEFHEVLDRFGDNVQFTSDLLTKKHDLENFELRLSSTETGKYFLCAKSEPLLDALWTKKFKK